MVLRVRQVAELTTLSVATIYREVAAGRFPAPVRLTPNTSGWLRSEIEAWLARRAEKARPLAAPPAA